VGADHAAAVRGAVEHPAGSAPWRPLRQGGLQIAVVIDEFGGYGRVSCVGDDRSRDLLEELVVPLEVMDGMNRRLGSASSAGNPVCGGPAPGCCRGCSGPDEVGEELIIFLPEEERGGGHIGGLVAHRLDANPFGESMCGRYMRPSTADGTSPAS
jgi:hypothetical protein